MNYVLYKNLFRLTWKNAGSYMWVFTVSLLIKKSIDMFSQEISLHTHPVCPFA